MKKKITAFLVCIALCICLLPSVALAATTSERYGKSSVMVENDCVSSYVVPKELFYYAYFNSSALKESDLAFRGGAFNSNSADSGLKTYSPAARLVVPMICVWDYEKELENEYPDCITASGDYIRGETKLQSDSWLVTSLTQDFLPNYADRAKFSELVLPMSLERIGKFAVQDCAKLTSVSFYDLANSRLKTIDDSAFHSCLQLSSVELPDTLATIGVEAFLNCPSLKTITVPASVTTIRKHALGYTTTDGNVYTKVDGFTIRGYKNSAAQEYAQNCGFIFSAIDGSSTENWQGTRAASIGNFASMPQAKYTSGQFTDVDENVWYGANGEKAIQTSYELRIVNGKGNGIFDPNGDVLLSEAIKMAAVVRKIYLGGNGVFTAKSWEAWYTPYVDYCISEGIIKSGDFSGSYARPATRAEMAYIFANTLPYSEMQTRNDVTALPDVSSVTPYYENILSMYRCGALRGNDDYGNFTPYANITRAAAAAIIARIALPEQRLSFTLKTQSQETTGSYTSGMWVNNLDALEKVYKERVWGLYPDMYVHMNEELANQLFGSDHFHNWIPFAVDTSSNYNENDDSLMAIAFTNYHLSFELDALLKDATVSARASAASKSYLSKIDSLLASLNLSGKGEREKLLAIHDWVVANVSYDMDFAEASYQFYGPLDSGKAVCQGYAELFYYLASRAGIECYTVSGMASSGAGMTDWESHMWNMVYLTGDKTPYYIDVTYDDPVPDTTTGRHDYFMVSAQKLSADHTW